MKKPEEQIADVVVGDIVYLRHYNEGQTFKVKSFNRDGSLCLYGGKNHYQSFRDLHPVQLTTRRPRSMPKIRTES